MRWDIKCNTFVYGNRVVTEAGRHPQQEFEGEIVSNRAHYGVGAMVLDIDGLYYMGCDGVERRVKKELLREAGLVVEGDEIPVDRIRESYHSEIDRWYLALHLKEHPSKFPEFDRWVISKAGLL